MPKEFPRRRAILHSIIFTASATANTVSACAVRQAREPHLFLKNAFPHTQRAAWQTVWVPQFALLGDEEDMSEISAAMGKIQRNAAAIAANASRATADRVAR